eukprot:gene6395-biopygen23873
MPSPCRPNPNIATRVKNATFGTSQGWVTESHRLTTFIRLPIGRARKFPSSGISRKSFDGESSRKSETILRELSSPAHRSPNSQTVMCPVDTVVLYASKPVIGARRFAKSSFPSTCERTCPGLRAHRAQISPDAFLHHCPVHVHARRCPAHLFGGGHGGARRRTAPVGCAAPARSALGSQAKPAPRPYHTSKVAIARALPAPVSCDPWESHNRTGTQRECRCAQCAGSEVAGGGTPASLNSGGQRPRSRVRPGRTLH